MVIESIMICVDSSEYMRNGDFLPTRLLAQQDAVYLLSKSKLRANPENKVGVLTLVNQRVISNLTADIGNIYSRLHQLQPNGTINFCAGLKTACLALKHREGRNHKTRIIAFVGSPVNVDQCRLMQLAKQFRKEKIHVDVISFGEESTNFDVLNRFIGTMNKDGTNNHFISVPEGCNLSDVLVSSPIINELEIPEDILEQNTELDYNADPELAMALLFSIREEEARIARLQVAHTSSAPPLPESTSFKQDDNQSQLSDTNLDFSELAELHQLKFALQMSLQSEPGTAAENEEDVFLELMNDPDFLENVIENFPELSPHREAIDEAIKNQREKKKVKETDESKKKEDVDDPEEKE